MPTTIRSSACLPGAPSAARACSPKPSRARRIHDEGAARAPSGRPLLVQQHRLRNPLRDHRGAERPFLRGLLRRGGVRQARPQQPKLHSEWRMLSGAGGWFVSGPDYLASSTSSIRRIRSCRTRSKMDRPGADAMDARPSRPLVQPRRQPWAGQGRWAVSHGGIMNVRGRDSPGGRSADRSSAMRSARPTARRCSWRCRGRAMPQELAGRSAPCDRRDP